ncbi:MAG: M1 family metallopeptidase [Candidatus Rokubacteria bacterium]|nr:M1 family metallopeptidase [Candidatus Rokubacteria bacterium]
MSYRLPGTVVPSRYELRLEPDLEAASFAGDETVTVTVREPIREIELNAAELSILAVGLEGPGGAVLEGQASLDPGTERARLTFPRPLEPGEWRLRLRFTGTLNDRLRGFYRSTYKDAAGHPHALAVTQFESTDARRAFPCWDEPAFKAVFSVTLVVPEGWVALSNTAAVAERPAGPGRRAVTFADSIRMSTYLVAFVVGELEATEPVMVGKTPVRVVSVPGKRRLAGFARDAAAFCLRYFEDYYGVPYPGDKLDLVGLPDFASGAMENLGAITFRETALLVDEAAASHTELERVADVVAHEVSHMWFGDLVTMAWWNGIWLNEAFATFMEMLAVDAWRPEWQRWVTFGVSRAAALGVDGLRASRPIEFPVEAPRDCEAMFDLLTYEKGASVLRMLEQHLGPETFRDGVRLYLGRHAYANAETTDLWRALGDTARQPIREVMDAWVFRPGYPLVTVEPGGPRLHLTQRRFTYLEAEAAAAERWRVPLTVRASVRGEVVERRLLFTMAEAGVPLPGPPDWVVVNAGGHGFYRVRYAKVLLDGVTAALSELRPIERFGLVSDLLALAQAGLLPAAEALEHTARFREESDRNVWTALIGSFAYLNRTIGDEARPGLAALVRDRVGPAAARLGWEPRPGESELERQLRGDLLRVLGTLGDDRETQARARELYARHQRDEAAVDPNVLPAVIAILAFCGGEPEYAEFLERFRRARTPQEEQRYLYALAGFRQPALLQETLRRTINGEVRTQDAPYLVRALLSSVYARGLAWEFVRAHWETMARLYPPSAYRRMYEGVTSLVSAEWEREIRAFFPERGIVLGGKTLEQYLEQLRVAVRFREREAAALQAYLAGPPRRPSA